MILHIITSLKDGGAQKQLYQLLIEKTTYTQDVLILKDGVCYLKIFIIIQTIKKL